MRVRTEGNINAFKNELLKQYWKVENNNKTYSAFLNIVNHLTRL